MSEDSASVFWRKKGNDHLLSNIEGLAPTLRQSRFEKALRCYEKALHSSRSDDETSSASKNAGTAEWKIARVCVESGQGWPIVKQHFGQAIKYYSNAYTKGETAKKDEIWKDNMLASCRECWEELSALTQSLTGSDKHGWILSIRQFIDFIPSADMKADCYVEIADYHFHKGVTLIANDHYKECLFHMKECYYPMNEALRYGAGIDRIQREYSVMEADVFMHTSLAECLQSRNTGDTLFEQVVMDEETLNIDMIWEVIDWYKDSIIKVRDLDVKQEAISLSRIGIVYAQVLKIKFKAKEYLKKSLELAQAIVPFTVTNEKWYKDCTAVLEQYQKETISHEQDEETKEKASAKEELKPELDDLEKHTQDDYSTYLKYLYEKYPPMNPDHKLDLTKKGNDHNFTLKYRSLQKAIIHYHPDRVDAATHGLKAKVLNEEITKHLTKRYEQVKSMK